MKRLNSEIIQFFRNQGFVVVTTIDKRGFPHSACKGIVKISPAGQIYLLDLYKTETYQNLKHNPCISVTAVDEYKFKGYCLKGKAEIVSGDKLSAGIIEAWENKVTTRITQRILRNIHEEKGNSRHHEAFLPKPEYMIVMRTEEIVDLAPHHIKQGA